MSMRSLSVYEEAEKALREHKWLASERAGRDLGHDAVREWTKSYWLRFYRWRFVQHLRGEVFWKEFDAAAFGIAGGRLMAHRELLDEIMDRVRDGAENLDLFVWAQMQQLPTEQLIEILEALDINSQRLPPPVGKE
jgi:hypothetical protein